MIHLKLSHQDAERLHHCLNQLQQRAPDDIEGIRHLLCKLHQAQLDAIIERLCPVCATPFAQDTIGRTGNYCSNACQQKAYRQRVNDRKRHFGPIRRT